MRTYSTKLFIVIVSIAHICFCQDDIYGCTDLLACNYNPEATIDDGSCLYNDCLGECGGTAELDDCGVCCDGITGTECSWYTDADNFGGSYDCSGECFGLAFNNECGCVEGSTGNDPDFCYGCTDPVAINYEPNATIDDGSCSYDVFIYISDITADYIEISMINSEPVYGFQFTIDATPELGAVFLGASGGMAQQQGFYISTNPDGFVLGFSFSGSYIPAGEGVLTYLAWTLTGSTGFLSITLPTFSDAGGSEYSVQTGDPYQVVTGCIDQEAVNYNPNANIDDGSCLYGEVTTQTFSFSSFMNNSISFYINPIEPLMVDIFQPLIDSGELANVADSLGNSIFETENWIVDAFQVYQVTVNTACELSVDGIFIQLPVNIYLNEGENWMAYPLSVSTDISEFFSAILDNGSIMIVYDSYGNFFTPEYGIDLIGELVPGQGYQVFMNFSDNLTVNLTGCTDPTSCTYLPQSNIDDGSCIYDDCYGECGGDAVVDECDVCNGFNEDVDCSGVCFGTASEDDCGVCDDNPENDNECIGCTDPQAYNYDSFYFIEDGSCIYLPSENLIYYNQILSGNLNSYIDYYNETGEGVFKSITIENIEGGEAGDEIGLLDYNGQINLGDCDEVSGEILVGGGIWNNNPITITSFGAIDICDGEVQYQQYPGWVENNLLLIHYWKASVNQVYIIHCNLSDELDNWSSDNIIIPSINLDEQTLYNINFDCSVDILDVIEVVNYILTDRTIEQYQLEIIDINSDEALDILDIILLVDYILSDQ